MNKIHYYFSVAIVMLVLSSQAQANPISWNLSCVTFADGGSAIGSFTYDADLNLFSNVSITTLLGAALLGTSYGSSDLAALPYRSAYPAPASA